MSKQRKQYSAGLKFEVALEAAKNSKTVSQLASEYGVHPTQVSDWKGQLMREGARLFGRGVDRQERETARTETELYEQIGRQKMELEWLKKKATGSGGSQMRHD